MCLCVGVCAFICLFIGPGLSVSGEALSLFQFLLQSNQSSNGELFLKNSFDK